MTEKNAEEKQAIKTVISYHTFVFPFLFETNKKMTRTKFKACCHPGWYPDVWEPNAMNDPIWYNQFHYFNEAAKNAIYMHEDFKDTSETVVENLRFDLLSLLEQEPKADPAREKERQRSKSSPIQYVIQKDENYYLDINAIRMKLFNTGVGVLVFELENRNYPSEADVIRINEFGRRIYAPYYAVKDNSILCSICAEALYFAKDKKEIGSNDDSGLLPEKLRTAADVTVLAKPIRQLLNNRNHRVTTEKHCAENEIYIKPVIDDRMFVACYYKNGDFVDAMREWDGDRYRYLTHSATKLPFDNKKNANAAHRLYSMIYVDGDGISCHGRDMLQNLLSDDHIYTRWLEYGWHDNHTNTDVFAGTITGFCEYSMISVAKNPPDYLCDSFLTQYVEIAILVLAQRASLLAFEYMISECAHDERNYNVKKIQKKYTLFQSQILLKEISPQQQGIDFYDMLEKNLLIQKEQNEIKDQIAQLFERTNYEHNKEENIILFILSVMGSVEAVDLVINVICKPEESILWGQKAGAFAVVIVVIVLLFVALRIWNKKR